MFTVLMNGRLQRNCLQMRMIMLFFLGNHDWSYLSKTVNGAGVSGHQNRRIDEIRGLLTENHDILDIAFECEANCPGGRIVFAHAGFSRT